MTANINGALGNGGVFTHWDLVMSFVKDYGTQLASEAAKKVSPAVSQAIRHAIYLTEEGPKPWIYKAAQTIRLTPNEVSAMMETVRAAVKEPEVQKAAVTSGGAATATIGLAAFLKLPVGTAFSMAPAASGALVTVSGAAGYGLGTLVDHAVGWIRDDGRSLTDLISGANAGVPAADPTGHGRPGWRFVPDEK